MTTSAPTMPRTADCTELHERLTGLAEQLDDVSEAIAEECDDSYKGECRTLARKICQQVHKLFSGGPSPDDFRQWEQDAVDVENQTVVAALVGQIGDIVTTGGLPRVRLTPVRDWWDARQEIVDIANRRIERHIPFRTSDAEIRVSANCTHEEIRAISELIARKSFREIKVVPIHPAVLELLSAARATS